MKDPKRIVAEGYDRIAERYAAWTGAAWTGPRAHYASLLWQRLPAGAKVLELGCGTGVPATRELARRFAVTGVDSSARSIALARRNVPGAAFRHADMASLELPAASFDAVVAFYSIIHVPRHEHSRLLRDIASWLRPGGLLVATMGAGATEDGYEEDWHGAPMYWSHYDSAINMDLVRQARLDLLEATELIDDEDGVPVTFLWVVAQKPEG
jgi:SAM-dependent methyltransferase